MAVAPAWQVFADTLLVEAALAFRIDRAEPPRDFAGIVITDDEVDKLLAELPGMRGWPSRPSSMPASSLGEARERFEAELAAGEGVLAAVAWNAGLVREEVEVLALLCAAELDPARQSLVAYLNDNSAWRRVTLGLVRRLFPLPHPGPAALGPDATLRRAALAAVDEEGPWASRAAWPADALTWMLEGDRSADPGLPDGWRIDLEAGGEAGHPLVLVWGGDAELRRRLGREAAAGRGFLMTPLPATAEAWDAVVRQATIAGIGVLVDLGAAEWTAAASRRVERCPHLAWVVSSRHELAVDILPDRPHHEIAAGSLATPVVRGGHALDAEQARLADRTQPGRDGEWDAAVRRLSGGHLDELAVRIRPRRNWSDLVLADEVFTQVHELASRYRRRRRVYGEWGFPSVPSSGITALFSGPSGTGKTMTAEVVAADLGLDLYRIDLSAVVSKYIGETEKNLERIFTSAASGNVVLFFDEADALFGKRSEVGDAHDRYANIEVSYLLQRLEQYDGIVVLSTNLRKNMDDAFLRRIDIAIEFTLPEPEQRRAIWAGSFPETAPVEGLDLDFLAERFDVSGGNITNAATAAAFLAAEEGTPIGMEHVVLGMKREFQKLGRLRTESEFARYLDLVNGERRAAPSG